GARGAPRPRLGAPLRARDARRAPRAPAVRALSRRIPPRGLHEGERGRASGRGPSRRARPTRRAAEDGGAPRAPRSPRRALRREEAGPPRLPPLEGSRGLRPREPARDDGGSVANRERRGPPLAVRREDVRTSGARRGP